MHRMDIPPIVFTFSPVLNACTRIQAIQEGKQTHTPIVESDHFGNKVVQTAFLDMYAKCRAAEDARRVLNQMAKRDVVTWTAMISGYSKTGRMDDARQLFDVMLERNVISWIAMVAGYANVGNVEAAKELFDQMPEKNSVTWTAMIVGYGKRVDVTEAKQVFDEIPACNSACWGYSNEAIDMYKKMREANVKESEGCHGWSNLCLHTTW
ncbi:PREDICTED: pentatricopeptide repeat-containing protein At2g35030, mitochondrial-like [Nelumbo nucifera]|uniref:Pentatricopeptide repeat-containing protein At2g35030, mitochondrial-like n=2 Tax=Nelumbo nucifera TaxID=4432 RepID=A0A1U8ACP7_NELNU|nr:PREDICTED: pentatricopeptide repeat-containing protein At2g35030, mitochondrial-like [Nelumbo nucifera]DAD34942.1 TPA_asm: hypothetical protein HUJ06_005582 [Nelumbo nucifera]